MKWHHNQLGHPIGCCCCCSTVGELHGGLLLSSLPFPFLSGRAVPVQVWSDTCKTLGLCPPCSQDSFSFHLKVCFVLIWGWENLGLACLWQTGSWWLWHCIRGLKWEILFYIWFVRKSFSSSETLDTYFCQKWMLAEVDFFLFCQSVPLCMYPLFLFWGAGLYIPYTLGHIQAECLIRLLNPIFPFSLLECVQKLYTKILWDAVCLVCACAIAQIGVLVVALVVNLFYRYVAVMTASPHYLLGSSDSKS